MACRNWMLAAVLVAMPAVAEDVAFEGHALQVDGSREARPILRMSGTKYSIPGSATQILGKAVQCVARQPGAITGASVDAEGGRLLADSRADYRQKGQRSVRAKLAVEAGDGNFRVVFTELATSPADARRSWTAGHAAHSCACSARKPSPSAARSSAISGSTTAACCSSIRRTKPTSILAG